MSELRCAVYGRYSSDKQSPTSIEDQVRQCREKAAKGGWRVLEDHIYRDEEISGATLERPGLKALLAAAESQPRPFDVVLIDDTSRLSRDQVDDLQLIRRLKFAGIKLVAVSQGIDSDSEQADVLWTVHGLVDALYLKELGQKTHRGLEGAALRRFHTGGRPAFGYQTRREEDGARLEIKESEAPTVLRIYELYASGYSLKGIAKKLNAEGVTSPQPSRNRAERSWAPSAIRQILLNEKYRGRVFYNTTQKIRHPQTRRRVKRARPESEWIRMEHPELSIVSDELWGRVQEQFRVVRSDYGQKARPGLALHWSAKGSRYLFSGLLWCGCCGGRMSIVSGAGKRAYAKWGCASHHYRGTCENDLTERNEVLEERLLTSLQEQVLRLQVVDYTLERFEAAYKAKVEEQAEAMGGWRKRDRGLEVQVQRLTDALALTSSPEGRAPIVRAIEEREAERRSIKDRLLGDDPASMEAWLGDLGEWVRSQLADARELLHADVPIAKAELRQHVTRIDLMPAGAEGRRFLIAHGEWDLAGGYASRRGVGAAGRS